jgi:hypothetical protein
MRHVARMPGVTCTTAQVAGVNDCITTTPPTSTFTPIVAASPVASFVGTPSRPYEPRGSVSLVAGGSVVDVGSDGVGDVVDAVVVGPLDVVVAAPLATVASTAAGTTSMPPPQPEMTSTATAPPTPVRRAIRPFALVSLFIISSPFGAAAPGSMPDPTTGAERAPGCTGSEIGGSGGDTGRRTMREARSRLTA